MNLEDVIAVEREIARLAEEEHSKADQWLADAKRDIDKNADDERSRLLEAAARDEERAKDAASGKAARIVEDAKNLSARLAALDDDSLRPLITKHIACLVPVTSP